ncbi:MAG: hypothetical protein K2M42_03640 [Oscillospiraceae bacterium]|nr:hypothetical protein [Oscillospiraceae bacterium]
MKKATISVTFDEEKLSALEFSLKKEGSTVQARLEETLARLYEQAVSEPVREYLDSRTAPPPRPRRPVRPAPKERPAPPETATDHE